MALGIHDQRGRPDCRTGGGTFRKVDEGQRRDSLGGGCVGKFLWHGPDAALAGFSFLDGLRRRSRSKLCTRHHPLQETMSFPSDGASPKKAVVGVEVEVGVAVEMLVGGCIRSSSF